MVRLGVSALLWLTLPACAGSSVGSPCTDDSDCGRGFDCSLHQCVQVCTSNAECTLGGECVRHRCQRQGAPGDATANVVTSPPPAPDPIAAELRAIRVELETVRREQQRLTELVETLGSSHAAPAPSSAPASPGTPGPRPTQTPPTKRVGIR